MRSMVEGSFGVGKAPPPPFGRSPSPAKAGEDFSQRFQYPLKYAASASICPASSSTASPS
jgi:hypothetical protein